MEADRIIECPQCSCSEHTKMESDTRHLDKSSAICAETVVIDSHAKKTLRTARAKSHDHLFSVLLFVTRARVG
jgi:hypothetical protein